MYSIREALNASLTFQNKAGSKALSSICGGERVETCDALDILQDKNDVVFLRVHHHDRHLPSCEGEGEQLIPFPRGLYPDAHFADRVLAEVLCWFPYS